MTNSAINNLFGRKILVASQNPQTRDLLATAFRKFLCNVIETNSKAGVAEALETYPDVEVVIYDTVATISDAIELLQKVSTDAVVRVPLFLITNRTDESLDEVFYHGVEGVFNEPLHFDELVKGVAFSYGLFLNSPNRLYYRQRVRMTKASYSLASSPVPLSRTNGNVTNISSGGMFISSNDSLPAANQIVEFRLESQGGEVIEVSGRAVVRWLRPFREYGRPPGFGIEFTELTELDRETIEKLWRTNVL